MLNQLIGQGVGAKLLGYHRLPFNWYRYLSCETLWSSTKGYPSSSTGCGIPVLREFRCIVGKSSTWRRLFVPQSHHRILDVLGGITAGWKGLVRLPRFCSPESSIAHLSHQPQASQKFACIRSLPSCLLWNDTEPVHVPQWPTHSLC